MNHKKKLKRKTEVLAAAVLLTAGLLWITPAGAQASGSAQNVPAQEETAEAAQAEKAAEEVKPAKKAPGGKLSADAADKEETVYAKADASGKVYDVSVETTLKNPDPEGKAPIEDDSMLKNIRNTEGDEEYKQEGSRIIWENHGEDISYKGSTDQELPVRVSITYFLDGKEISPAELAGKSGSLRVRIDYKNMTAKEIDTGERTVSVPVPFAACTIMFLPEENFRNIAVENGRLVSMEGTQAVIGTAMPGLSECLKLEEYELTKEIEIPEYVEITADVKDFKLDFTATLLSGGLFKELEEKDIKDLEKIPDDIEELTEATGKLADGGKALYDGAGEFGSYLTEYINGAGQLGSGIGQIKNGLEELSKQNDALTGGANSLRDGLAQLDAALAAIDFSGAEIDMTPAAEASQALASDAEELAAALQGIQSLLQQMQGLMGQMAEYGEGVNGCVSGAREALAGLESADLTEEERAALEQAVAYLDAVPELVLPEINTGETDIEGIVSDMKTQLETLSGMAEGLSGKGQQFEQLQTKLAELKTAVSQLAQGSGSLSEGIAAYSGAVSKLCEGTAALQEGSCALSSGGEALAEGYSSLLGGTGEMADGLGEFKRELAGELQDYAGEELRSRIAKIKGLRSADLTYNNFGGLADGRTGSVRFIIETDEIR